MPPCKECAVVRRAAMLQAIDPRHRRVGHGERGAIAIIAAIVMPIMILALAFGIDIGHLAYVQRNLQKMADMSAIAGAEDVSNASALAMGNAVKNGLQTSSTQMTVTPGNWNPQIEARPTYFSPTVPYGHQANAVQVQLSQTVPYFFFFGPAKTVQAQAIAWVPNPAAGISIGSTLATVNTTESPLLNGILGGLLHTSLNISAVGYQGLANTNINLGQLAQSLDIGSVNSLLTANLNLPQLYQGALTVLGNQKSGGLLNSNGATGALSSMLGSADVPGTIQLGKIIDLGISQQAAASAQVNLLDLISASAMLANGHHFIDTGLNVLGVATLGLTVISPPQLAYGLPGKDASGNYRTEAKTAQVALQLSVLGDAVNVELEVSPAIADLTAVNCAAPLSQSTVGIRAGTAILAAQANVLVKPSPFNSVSPANFQNLTFTGLPAQSQTIGSTSGQDMSISVPVNVLGLIKINLGALLSPVINLLAPVLQLLGIQLGTANVGYNALSCGTIPPVLVY